MCVCVDVHVYTQTHTYIYYVPLYVCVCACVHTHTSEPERRAGYQQIPNRLRSSRQPANQSRAEGEEDEGVTPPSEEDPSRGSAHTHAATHTHTLARSPVS